MYLTYKILPSSIVDSLIFILQVQIEITKVEIFENT